MIWTSAPRSSDLVVPDGMWLTVFGFMPSAVRYVGTYDRTYVPIMRSTAEISLIIYDHDSEEVGVFQALGMGNLPAYDHLVASVLVPREGHPTDPMWFFWAGQGGDWTQHIYFRKTTSGDDFRTLGAIQTIDFGSNNRAVYVHPVYTPSGRILIFVRITSPSNRWVISYSDDNGSTWTTREWLVRSSSGPQIYQTTTPVEGEPGHLWIGQHLHPTGSDQTLRLLRVDTATGDVWPGDADPSSAIPIANLYAPSGLPVDWTSGQLVYDAAGGGISRLSDVNPWGDFLYIRWTGSVAWPNDATYVMARRQSDGSYTHTDLIPAGRVIQPNEHERGYFGDGTVSYENRDKIWVAAEDGGNWTVFEGTYDGSQWFFEPESAISSVKKFRPRAVVNAHPSLPMMWVEGAYIDVREWDTDIKSAAYHPDPPPTSGHLTFHPAPSEPLTFAPAGAFDEPEAPSAAPTVTLTPASQTALSLSLSEVDGATGYRYRVGTSGSWTDLGSGRTAQITSLTPGTSYTVQARAYNAAGDGPIGTATASTLEPEVNAPPVFQTSPPTSVRAGQVYVYNGVVTDADGDPITITLEEGPDWLELTDHGDGTFTLGGTAPNE